MQLPSKHPAVLALAFALVQVASFIVPPTERSAFASEWQQKLFHRWQFLAHAQFWTAREAARLLLVSTLCIPAAIQYFAAQDSISRNTRRFVQSPYTCLSILSLALIIIAVVSRGLPATRNLLFPSSPSGDPQLAYVWMHSVRGGGDRPIPIEVVQAWQKESHLATCLAPFRALHRPVQTDHAAAVQLLTVSTTPAFFDVLSAHPLAGAIPRDKAAILLSYQAWMDLFRGLPSVAGKLIRVGGKEFPIQGIMPRSFHPLSRQITLYLIEPRYVDDFGYVAVRVKPHVTRGPLDNEFTRIAEDVTYFFLQGQLRYGFARSELWTPVFSFLIALFASTVTLLVVLHPRKSVFWHKPNESKIYLRRAGFFLAKTGLALLCLFTACLEWSRSSSAILFGNFDPASGPFLLWLYIVGTMGVLFWSAFDQKARCRECLQLLAFPVRMGSPGNMLLDWSGIELCCSQGHGVLHVPHLAPSWEQEAGHWITLDNSWQDIFRTGK